MSVVDALRARMAELKDLSGALGLLTWDQETNLPPKGAGARASQLATLQAIHHARLTDPALGELLEQANADPAADADLRAAVRVLTWERGRSVNVPERLVRALAEAQGLAVEAWKVARQEDRFELFSPHLDGLLTLRREQADAIGHQGERYDALLDAYEPGMRVARLAPVLEELRERLAPWAHALSATPTRPPNPLGGRRFDLDRQWRVTLRLLEAMGFDFAAGRQDRSVHPFTGGTAPTDVRLTTRLSENDLLEGLSTSLHEGGHGLYEQGFAPELHHGPLAAAPSMGMHESQSRLWENLVGRSRPFAGFLLRLLRTEFPVELAHLDEAGLHGSLNQVRPSFIRVEADEVTYNLHIVLRFELELSMLRGTVSAKDLPEAWREGMGRLLGVVPPDDRQGVLQDIHWAWGELGYFPTYTLGNLYASSLFATARRALPELDAQLEQGQLRPLREWLRSNVHQHGFRTPAEDRIREVCGEGLTIEPFLEHLREKYAALYGVVLPRSLPTA